MNSDIVANILQHKRLLIVIGVVFVIICIGLGILSYYNNRPVPLKKTNLVDASSTVKDKAAAQMTIPIKNMPSAINETTAKYLENQLAYILRQKYGSSADSFTATVRQVIGYDDAGGYSMYVDVPNENETYLAYVNMANQIGSFACAPQDQQMDPANSHCYNLPSIDNSNFPNG